MAILIAEDKDGDPRAIVEARGLTQITDQGAIAAAVDAIIAANPAKVAQAQAKPSMLGWFVGQVMKETGWQGQSADRQRASESETRALKYAPRITK